MNLRGPTIGVVVPTYNSARFVEECLRSIKDQTYKPVQIVICDDASSDNTLELIRGFTRECDIPIEIVAHSNNLGIPRNFNSGLRRIRAEYVSLIAGDDIWHTEKLAREMTLLVNRKADAAYSACLSIDDCGNFLGPFQRAFDGVDGNVLFEMLMHQMAFRSPLLRMSLLREIGFFDERLSMFEDWDLKIRYVARAKIAHSDFEAVYYRRHSNGISRIATPWQHLVNLIMVYKFNSHLIRGLPLQQRQAIIARKRRECERLLKESYNSISKFGLASKVRWLGNLLLIEPRICISFVLNRLTRSFLRN